MKSISFSTKKTSDGKPYTHVLAVCEFKEHTRIEIDMNVDTRNLSGKSLAAAQLTVLDMSIEELQSLRQTYAQVLDQEKQAAATQASKAPNEPQ